MMVTRANCSLLLFQVPGNCFGADVSGVHELSPVSSVCGRGQGEEELEYSRE